MVRYKAVPADHADFDMLGVMAFYSKGKIYDDKWVYGWLVENYIIGPVIEATNDYINFHYWIPIKPETVERIRDEGD